VRPGSPSPTLFGAVALGGALGAILRYLGTELVPDGSGFPQTTFAINVIGSLLLAVLPHWLGLGRPYAMALLGPGLLGGFTTLSAYSEHTRSLLATGHEWLAMAYVVGTLVTCVSSVWFARRFLIRARQV
jgi:fluoride exporter